MASRCTRDSLQLPSSSRTSHSPSFSNSCSWKWHAPLEVQHLWTDDAKNLRDLHDPHKTRPKRAAAPSHLLLDEHVNDDASEEEAAVEHVPRAVRTNASDTIYNACVVCFSEPSCMLTTPCNHLCLCQTCASRIAALPIGRKCVICSQPAIAFVPVYLPNP